MNDWVRPDRSRRLLLLALILALHVGFFLALKNGLLQRVVTVLPSNVVTATIFPPAPPAVPAPVKPLQPAPRRTEPIRPKPSVRNTVVPHPIKTAPQTLAPAPAVPAPAPAPALAPAEPPPPAPPAVPAAPRTITSGVQYLQQPQPDYPPQSKRLGEEGRVVLKVAIDESGRSGQITVQKSSGFARLDEAAIDAIRRAQFKAHFEDGKPLAVFVIVPISFRLDQ